MKISIITVTYNSGETLRDTIESVLAQTYQNYEHLIIDGNSKDNTIDIIKEYVPQYSGRLRWISERDRGIYDAMNKGIIMASGDVVGVLNSDDFFTRVDALQTIADGLSQNSTEAVYADVYYVKNRDTRKCVRYYSSRRFRPWMMKLGFMPAHPTFYCQKKVYNRHGIFDLDFRVAADFDCLLRFIYVHRIHTKYIPQVLVTMRRGGASSSGWQSHKKIWLDHRKAYKKNGVKSNFFYEGIRYAIKEIQVIKSKIRRNKIEQNIRLQQLESHVNALSAKVKNLMLKIENNKNQ